MAFIKAPLALTIEITGRCQLNCAYCFACPRFEADLNSRTVLELIDDAISAGVFRIDISGGEPFLHPRILDILSYIIKRQIPVWSVSSNGVLFSDRRFAAEVATLLRTCEPATHLQVSIDSHFLKVNQLVRGRTQEAMSGIENLIAEGVMPTIASVLHKANWPTLLDSIRYFVNLGVSSFHFMNLMNTVELQDSGMWEKLAMPIPEMEVAWRTIRSTFGGQETIHIDTPLHELLPALNENQISECIECHRCTAGFTHLVVLPNLSVVPCSNARIAMGKLQRGVGLLEIWNSPRADELRAIEVNPCEIVN